MKTVPAALHKTPLGTLHGHLVYTVDGDAVRDSSEANEEFIHVGIHEDFPGMIPADEVWLDRILSPKERAIVADAAVRRYQYLARGVPSKNAYDRAKRYEKAERTKADGPGEFPKERLHPPDQLYVRMLDIVDDPREPGGEIHVWLVNGQMVRDIYKTDFTEGGNYQVYRWMPPHEVWIEEDVEQGERKYIMLHEVTELRLMRDEGLSYPRAHAKASKAEWAKREKDGVAGGKP